MKNMLYSLYKDQRGDSEIVDTAIALIFILGLFVGFFLYSNAARTKVIMNYSAKEGARAYAISKDASEGRTVARDYLSMGNVNSANVSDFGDSGMKITNSLNVTVPFFNGGDNLSLVSEFEFFEEFDPKYYELGELGEGWIRRPYTRSRQYRDDSTVR